MVYALTQENMKNVNSRIAQDGRFYLLSPEVLKIQEIGLRTSEAITRDDITVLVPNSMITTSKVINWSHQSERTRFNIKVGVAYGSDTKLVSKILMDCAEEHTLLNKTRKGFVNFKEFGESSLDFELYFWASEIFRIEIVKSDLRFMIDKAFRENGITIPFPQRDVHMKPSLNK